MHRNRNAGQLRQHRDLTDQLTPNLKRDYLFERLRDLSRARRPKHDTTTAHIPLDYYDYYRTRNVGDLYRTTRSDSDLDNDY